MTDDRRPDYDFFAPTPPPPSNPPYGTQATPYSPGPPVRGQVLPQGGNWTYAQSIPPQRSGLPGWAIALIAGAVGFVVLAILAAIAIPVFLSQRAKAEWQSTTVSLPPTLAGLNRNTSSAAGTLADGFAGNGVPAGSVGIYGELGANAVIVIAVKTPRSENPAEQQATQSGFERSFAGRGDGTFSLTQGADPGKLGGRLGCGTLQTVQVCVATNANSIVSVVTGSKDLDPVTLTRQAREAAVLTH